MKAIIHKVVCKSTVLAMLAFCLSACSDKGTGKIDPTAPEKITCEKNLRQIGISMQHWALDHNNQFPFNVSTNEGGTREICVAGADGFASDALPSLLATDELNTPAILVCPTDAAKKPATSFASLKPENLTYRLRVGTNVSPNNPKEVLAICPVDGNTLYCNGSVKLGKR